jgi:membrane protease YdiL (CAAX protease family)
VSTTTYDVPTAAPVSTGRLRQLVARHSVAIYFTLVVIISWGAAAVVLGPASFPLSWERFETLGGEMYALFLAGPVIAGLALIGIVDGRAGYRDLLARLRTWRVGARSYALALMPAVALAIVALGVGLVAPALRPTILTANDRASILLAALGVSVLFGFFEELGWTGFVVPRMLRRHGAFTTGIVVGLVWAAWHFPLFWKANSFAGALPLTLLLVQLVSVVPGFRVLMVRLYAQTKSLLVAVVMHASLVMTQLTLRPPTLSDRASLLDVTIGAVTIWTVVAIYLAASRRGRRSETSPPLA